jgi:hypothetical protein
VGVSGGVFICEDFLVEVCVERTNLVDNHLGGCFRVRNEGVRGVWRELAGLEKLLRVAEKSKQKQSLEVIPWWGENWWKNCKGPLRKCKAAHAKTRLISRFENPGFTIHDSPFVNSFTTSSSPLTEVCRRTKRDALQGAMELKNPLEGTLMLEKMAWRANIP